MIFFAGDLHYGKNTVSDMTVEMLAADTIRRATPQDTLCLLGDISPNPERFAACLTLFRDFPGTKCAVAGNHDLWVVNGRNSLERLAETSSAFEAHGFHPLEDRPLMVGNTGFVGTIGWYDYSFRDDIGIPLQSYEAKYSEELNVYWADVKYIKWPHTDASFTDYTAKKLQQHLAELRDVSQVICCMHHLPTKQLLVHPRMLVPRPWRFSNAFLGSNRYAEVLRQDPRVRLSVSGHIHLAREKMTNQIRYATVGSADLEKELLIWDGRRLKRQTFRLNSI